MSGTGTSGAYKLALALLLLGHDLLLVGAATSVKLREYSFDGTGNNATDLGAAGKPFARNYDAEPMDYGDSPSARQILRDVYLAHESPLSTRGVNQAWVYWGLLVYHDLVDTTPGTVAFNIPCDDGVADAQCPVAACPAAGAPPVTVPYTRARAALVGGVRTPLNAATAFLDLDGIYGRDEATARALRDTSASGGGSSRYMALSAAGLPLWDRAAARWRIADQRNARLPGTFALHALLLREHNRRAAEFTPAYLARLQAATPEGCQPKDCREFTEDDIYYAARAFVIAVAQHITLHEFMPQLLGLPSSEQPNAKRDYTADPTIDLLAAVAFRWPYTALGPVDRVVDASWAPVPDADLAPVGGACGAAAVVRAATGGAGGGGLDAALRGMMLAGSAAADAFLPPRGATSCLDEPVIDIQAARDFGAPTYNDARRAAGLAPKASFNAITNDTRAAAALETAYGGDIEAVDMLVGGLAEAAFAPTPATVSVLGELFTTILTAQLLKLKPADSLWHDHSNMLEDSRASSLSVVVARNRDALAASPPDPSATAENVTFPVEAFKPVQISIDTGATSSDAQARQIAFVPGVYEIAWSIDKSNKTIVFDAAFTGMNGGYFALGMGTRMIGADIFAFCDFSGGSGNVNITDRVGTANALPVGDEWQAGGACANDVWLAKDGYVYDDKTKVHRVSFGRPLSAADACDTAIEDATQSIVWSFNPDAPNMQHEFTHRGIYSVNFYTGESAATPSSASPQTFFAFHGLVMLLAWGLCAPMAFYVARYKKHWKNWIDVHELMASFAAEASLPIAIAAMTTAKGKFATTHGKIGLTLFLAVILQFFSGLLRRAGITNRANKYFGTNYDKVHQFNKVFHRVFGRLVVLLGLLNVLVGLLVISPKDTQVQVSGLDTTGTDSLNIQVNWFSTIKAYVYPAVLSLWFVLFFAAEVHLRIGRRRAQKQVKRQLNVTTITMEQFNDRVLQGEKLLLVNDAVIDVHEYMKVHPGGSKVMKESIGCDVTKEVLGVRGMEQGLHKQAHKHSAKAWAAIQKMVVAYVDKEDEVLDYTDTPAALGSVSKGGSAFGGSSTDPGSSMGGSVSSSSSSRRRAFGAEQAFVKFILRSKRTLTNEKGAAVVSFVFEPKVKSRSLEALAPGYYHKFRVVHEGSVIQRSYTPVGQHQIRPGVLGFEYYIRLYPGGQMSAALAKLRVNDTVRAQGPFEIRELQQDVRHVFMIAGGTGITPMLQFVRCHVAKGVQLAADAGTKDADAGGDANDAAAAAADPAHDQQLTVRAGSAAAVAQLAPGASTAAAPPPPPQASAQQRALAKAQLGVAMMHGMEELVPARTMALLWQTRSDVDGFCLSELQGIADASEMLRKADPSVGAHFYFTNYATKFVIASGIISPGGRRHDTVAQHRAGRRRGSLMGRFKAAEDHAAAAAAATAAAAAAPAASVRAVAEDIEGGGGGDGGSGGGKGGSGDNGSGGGGGGEAEAGAAAASASAARKAWRTIAWVATGFEAHASTPRGSAAAARHIADADAFDHGSGGGGGDAAGALPPRHGAAESGSSGGGDGTVKTAGRWCCGDVSAVETPPRRVSVSGTPPGAGATDAAAAPTPALEASSPRRGSVTTGLFPGRDGAQNQIIEGALSPAALHEQLAPLLEGLRRTGQLTTSEGAGSGGGGSALTPALAAADADTADGGSDGAAEWYNPRTTRIIISGPPGFVDVVEQRLRDLGVPENVLCFLD